MKAPRAVEGLVSSFYLLSTLCLGSNSRYKLPFLIATSTTMSAQATPLPTPPKEGWKAAAAKENCVDPSRAETSPVFMVMARYPTKPGKAEEFIRGMDATQGKFYRLQPGCIAYYFGLDAANEDLVHATALYRSKELFDKSPLDPQDLDQLNTARGPYRDMIAGDMVHDETSVCFGPKDNGVADRGPGPTWNQIMGRPIQQDPTKLYSVNSYVKTQKGKAEFVAKGLEVCMGTLYRNEPECLHYRIGIASDIEDTFMIFSVWTSKEAFDSSPKDAETLERLNRERAPFFEMLEGGSVEKAATVYHTKMVLDTK